MYTEADKKAYWSRANQNKEIARRHTEEMNHEYHDEIASSVRKSTIYRYEPVAPSAAGTARDAIRVVPKDTVSAIFDCGSDMGSVAALNFASYKNPGGRFFDGSMAQEEALCHASFLYNVLREFDGVYYAENRKRLNNALYRNAAIYSEDVRFFLGRQTKTCDIITCACPNRTAAQKYARVSDAENLAALRARCEFVLSVAKNHDVDTLILGAFGCGVFGQDAREVAEAFSEALGKYQFKNVIFAIPNTGAGSRNYAAFAEMFGV